MTRTSQTRDRILEGTAAAVTERGVQGTTVKHILECSEVSRRTFYQYFRNRDDAVVALYEAANQRMLTRIAKAVIDTEDPLDKIMQGVDAYLMHQQAEGPLLWAMSRESIHPDSPLFELRKNTIDGVVAFIDQQFKEVAGLRVDPLVYLGLIGSIDVVIRHLQIDDQFGTAERERVAALVKPVVVTVLAAVPTFPTYEG